MPALLRPEKAEPYRQQILELLSTCKGNLVRVQEELAASGVNLSYSALTAFCRRHGIGQPPAVAVGRYDFLPGEELQHDTSPHEVELAGKRRKVQTASAVLCLLAHVVLSDVSDLSAFRLQGLSDRGTALLQRCSSNAS